MCVQTAEPYVEPPNDVDTEMATRKLKNRKATGNDEIPAKLTEEGKTGNKMSFMNSFKKYGRKRQCHMSGNVT